MTCSDKNAIRTPREFDEAVGFLRVANCNYFNASRSVLAHKLRGGESSRLRVGLPVHLRGWNLRSAATVGILRLNHEDGGPEQRQLEPSDLLAATD
jgi:hypothetical protein